MSDKKKKKKKEKKRVMRSALTTMKYFSAVPNNLISPV
jgi:hypothetical protein